MSSPTLNARQCVATLPNCDGCGQFTSDPVHESWCFEASEYHACYEALYCRRCAAKRGLTEKERASEQHQ